MAPLFDCSVGAELLTGMRFARSAIGKGEIVVIPTDTVYGVAADAFQPDAVQRLLDAKGRGRESPPPVLVPGITIILPARHSLSWDLGETRGTVALRMPSNRVALELLSEVGPLAVSSANLTGKPAAHTAIEARDYLGDSVAVYLDDGEVGKEHVGAPDPGSTIVDATGLLRPDGKLRIVRHGVISDDAIIAIVGADRCE
jgi:L-threonylcarbamoyladenylate synthase